MKKGSNVGKNAVTLTSSKIFVSMISVVSAMLLARFRTLEEYGTYSQIILVVNLATTFILLGLPNSINYFLAKANNQKEQQKFLSLYMTLSLILTIIMSLMLVALQPMIINYFNNPFISAFSFVFIFYPWASLMINSLSNTCIVYSKTKKLTIFNILYAVTNLIILLICKWFGMTFNFYMKAFMLSMTLFAIFAVYWMRKLVGNLKLYLNKKLIINVFKFSIPIGLASIIGTLNIELDKLVIGYFFSTEEYAVFTNAAKELPLTMLASSVTAVLLPQLVKMLKRDKTKDAIKLWGNSINISYCIMCLFVGGLIVFAPDAMSLFYSKKYVTPDGLTVFRIYNLILLFRCTYWGIILNATGNTKYIMYSSILCLVFNVIGNIIGCYVLGFIGPAVSSLIVIFIMSLFQLFFTCKIVKVEFKHIFPWKTLFKFTIQIILFIIVFWIIRYNLLKNLFDSGYSIYLSIVLGLLWSIIYLFINKTELLANWKELNS